MGSLDHVAGIDIHGEKAAFEALIGHLRMAEEATRNGKALMLQGHIKQAVAAASELGTRLSDGRWAALATQLERARVAVTKKPQAVTRHGLRDAIAEQIGNLRQNCTLLRHGARGFSV